MSNIAGVLKDFFASHQQKVVQAAAPARLDVMGGISDVAGALLVQKVQDRQSTAYVAARDDQQITLKLIYQDQEQWSVAFSYPDIMGQFPSLNYEYARQQILQTSRNEAVLTLVGSLLILFDDQRLKFEGLDVIIVSDVPPGTGIGAGISYQIALLKAVSSSLNLSLTEHAIPNVAHRAENWIGGFCSGSGGHLASFAAAPQRLTPITSVPSEVFHPINIPDNIALVGIDTGIPVSLSDEAYGHARTAMFMGYSIIALSSGATVHDLEIARETQDWSTLPYQGRIAAIHPSEFEDKFLPVLPERLSGQQFIDKYQTTIDVISFIDRDKEYLVRNCTRHPVYENFRAKMFAQIIKNYTTEFQNYSNRLNLMGELMYQSHQSYVDCGLSHPQADDLVSRVKQGSARSLYGARVTAQGGGGTVCVLCGGISGPEHAREIHEAYQRSFGSSVAFFK